MVIWLLRLCLGGLSAARNCLRRRPDGAADGCDSARPRVSTRAFVNPNRNHQTVDAFSLPARIPDIRRRRERQDHPSGNSRHVMGHPRDRGRIEHLSRMVARRLPGCPLAARPSPETRNDIPQSDVSRNDDTRSLCAAYAAPPVGSPRRMEPARVANSSLTSPAVALRRLTVGVANSQTAAVRFAPEFFEDAAHHGLSGCLCLSGFVFPGVSVRVGRKLAEHASDHAV